MLLKAALLRAPRFFFGTQTEARTWNPRLMAARARLPLRLVVTRHETGSGE